MLVDVLAGQERGSAASCGTFHFARAPKPGEQVEIDGDILVVAQAWHRPDVYYQGAKFAILVAHQDVDAKGVPASRHAETIA